MAKRTEVDGALEYRALVAKALGRVELLFLYQAPLVRLSNKHLTSHPCTTKLGAF